MKRCKLAYLILLIFVSAFPAFAQHQPKPDTLLVGIAGSRPFVADTLTRTGISLEIWEQVTEALNIPFKTKTFEDVPHALAALAQGQIDAVAGPVSITSERAEVVRFTQPYYQSSLSILSLKHDPNLWQRIAPFFSGKFFVAVSIFLFILAIVGALLWLVERRVNPDQFPHTPARGIANGMWCAIVTMTTTGYGDIAPSTFWGRFIAGAWMIISLVLATTMIAGIASTLTLTGMTTTNIATAEELNSKKIGVIADSPGEDFSRGYGAKIIHIPNLEEGMNRLMDRKIDGIVYDRPQLLYYSREKAASDATVSVAEYERQGYGFAFPLQSPMVHDFNVELLNLQENGRVAKIVSRWLGNE